MGVFDAAWIAATLAAATPLLLAGTGELVSQRSGTINLGLEGMMLFGAFFSYWTAVETGSIWLGVLMGVVAGMTLAGLMAFFSITMNADQIVVGIGILILGIGVTSSMFRDLFEDRAQILLDPMPRWRLPVVGRLPFFGDAFFDQRPLVYLAFLLLPAAWFVLYRTTWGLAIRAAGDLPAAAETAGLSPRRIRWAAILVAGAMSGLAGAFLSVGEVGIFLNNMAAGRGFLALAAVIFGMWRVKGLLGACLLFGGATALQRRLQGLPQMPREIWVALIAAAVLVLVVMLNRNRSRWRRPPSLVGMAAVALSGVAALVAAVTEPSISLPSELWLAMPFVLTIVALAVVGEGATAPRYLAASLQREHG